MPRSPWVLLAFALPLAAQQAQFQTDTQRLAQSYLPDEGSRPWLTIADANGDGRADVVSGSNSPTARANLHTRQPDGSWVTLTAITSHQGRAIPIDLDFDGDQDLLFLPASPVATGVVSLLRRDPTAITAVALPTGLQNVPVQGAAVGDVDGDGLADLLVAHLGGGPAPMQLWRGTGNLTFTLQPAAVPGNLPFGCWPTLADVDGDGDVDVLASCPSDRVVLLRNQAGTFVDARASLPAMRLGHSGLQTGDFDRDGRVDALMSWWNGDLDALWGTATGFQFQAAVVPGLGATQLLPADLDGDLDLDVVTPHPGELKKLVNQGNRTFAVQPFTSFLPPGFAIGDLDGDGHADLLFNDLTRFLLRCWLRGNPGREDVALQQGMRSPAAYHQVRHAPFAGDVDGDGRTDVLFPSTLGLVVQHADGPGRWRATTTAPVAADTAAERYRLVDLDGDQDLDLVAAYDSTVRVLANDGAGNFTQVAITGGPAATLDPLRLGDVDGDGDVDIVRVAGVQVILNRNLGNLQFSGNVVLATSPGGNTSSVALVDCDGDLDLDVITDLAQPSSRRAILANDGTGAFTISTAMFYVAPTTPGAFGVGDVDGDGDPDLTFTELGELRLHLNLGNGVFVDVSSTHVPPLVDSYSDAILADLDDDGDLDYFATRFAPPNGWLLRNDGTGRFTDVSAARLRTTFGNLNGIPTCNAQDIDDDGDLDLLLGTGQFLNIQAVQAVLVNHTRQCSSQAIPRPGGAFAFDVFATPGSSPPGLSLLLASFGLRPPLTIPGLDGGYQLDTATLVTVGATVTAPIGVFRQSVPIPPSLVFVGADLFWQQLLLPQTGVPGFSNAVHERIIY